MDAIELLRDSFNRIADELPGALDGLEQEQLLWQPDPAANSIGWLAWHIGRCEDVQMAALTGADQVYCQGWDERFALPYDRDDLGYGQSAEQVRAFKVNGPEVLVQYYERVHEATGLLLDTLRPEQLDELVDDPYKVTVGVRLVSIVNDVTQHMGQISYLRGLQLGHE